MICMGLMNCAHVLLQCIPAVLASSRLEGGDKACDSIVMSQGSTQLVPCRIRACLSHSAPGYDPAPEHEAINVDVNLSAQVSKTNVAAQKSMQALVSLVLEKHLIIPTACFMASAEANPTQASSVSPPFWPTVLASICPTWPTFWPRPLDISTADFSMSCHNFHHELPIGW